MRLRTLQTRMMHAAHAKGYGLKLASALLTFGMATSALSPAWAQSLATPVPGYVAPVTQEQAPDYVDDTRGVFIPTHPQQRMKTEGELAMWRATSQSSQPYYGAAAAQGRGYETALNTVANGVANTDNELDRIARDPGLLSGGKAASDADLYTSDPGVDADISARQLAQNTVNRPSNVDLNQFPSLATGGQARVANPSYGDLGSAPADSRGGDGTEIMVSPENQGIKTSVDMQNGVVRLKEERIAVRRALQRMMDQIGAGSWTIVWDLDEQNAGLPDMEISIHAEEPFMNVLNALLGRLQSRSGQPLRVIRYDKTQRLVITDRAGGGERTTGTAPAATGTDVAVTETVLKESVVSLHYDEVPLVDALENIVNQAGKGQWRLRMYAGTDQVIKPAHIEEPFGVALERILKIFNLRYEVFPGGKLIVVTSGDRFGFRGVE